MRRYILMLAAMLLSCSFASGRSKSFAETQGIVQLGRFAQIYHRREGVYPKTWAEFESRMGSSDKICTAFDPKERLVFVTADVFVPAYPTKERIILISREPFRPPTEGYIPLIGVWYKTLGDRVYVAAVQQGDDVFVRKITPERAAQIFKEAGVALPAPSGLGLYRHERAHRSEVIVRWVGLVVYGVLIVRAVLRRRKARRGGGARVAG
jgi:hypothetical protein